MSLSLSFEKEVVVVVGAASGIGHATAELFQEARAHVVRLDRVPVEGDDSYEVDATDLDALQAVANKIHDRYQRIDHVVVSIGASTGSLGFPFWNVPPGQWEAALDVNLVAPVRVAHAFVPFLVAAEKGTICFVVSVAGQIGSQTDPPYSAAKAGLINFMQCAARDLAGYNVRVNAVSPGMVKTPLNRSVWQAWRESSADNRLDYEDWAEEKIQRIAPLGRWQTGKDVAAAVGFLASDLAKNMTGQTVNVDGGQVMHS